MWPKTNNWYVLLLLALCAIACKEQITTCSEDKVVYGIVKYEDVAEIADILDQANHNYRLINDSLNQFTKKDSVKVITNERIFEDQNGCKVAYKTEQIRVSYTSPNFELVITADVLFPNEKQIEVLLTPNINGYNRDEMFVIELNKKHHQAQLQSFSINGQTYNNVQVFVSNKGGYLITTTTYQILEIRTHEGQIITKNI